MRVSDIMTQAAVSDQADDSLADAARRMWEQQTGSLLVMEGGGLVGIITERDILKAVATGTELEKTTVEQVMVRDLVTIHPGASLREAARVMNDKWIRHLPVMDGTKLVGILSQRDLAGVLGTALNEPEALEQLIDASELARERRLSRIESGVWD
ncbi:MAG: cyclic nucleotide-binding/CBS domain-containing protein [Actinomycetota bacterium]